MNLPDDILGAILERIDSHVCLHRAASTCKRWRGIIADAAFRRRFRSLHASAVVAGVYCNHPPLQSLILATEERRTKGSVFFIPSSSSPIDASHYSLDFLPDNDGGEDNWRVEDNRGSLLLMNHSRSAKNIRYLLLCEPLTQRYRIIPQPQELVAGSNTFYFRRYYLIDGAAGREEEAACSGNIGMSNFRVLCEHYMGHGLHIMVFDPADDGSDASTSAWKEKDVSSIVEAGVSGLRELGRAAGSWYFCDADRSNLLIVLDGRTGELSTSTLPASENWEVGGRSCDFCVTEGRDGEPRVCSVGDGIMKVFAMRGGEWALEKRLLLEEAIRGLPGYKPWYHKRLTILTRGPGFIILLLMTALVKWTVSVDLETMEVALGVEDMGPMLYRCELPWPPVFNTCVDRRP